MLSLFKKSPCSYEDHHLSDRDAPGQSHPQEAREKRPVIAKQQEGQGHQSEAGNGDRDNRGREIFEAFQKGDHRAYLREAILTLRCWFGHFNALINYAVHALLVFRLSLKCQVTLSTKLVIKYCNQKRSMAFSQSS